MASSGIAALEVSDRIAPGASSSNEVATLLASLNLQQYIGVFLANEVNTIPRLKAMQDVHYHRLGVLLGHQLDIIDRFRSYNESLVHVSQVVGPMSNAPSQQLGHKRDLDSEEPNSKRQRHNVVENSIFPVVESISNSIASFQSASEPAVVDLNASHATFMYQRALQHQDKNKAQALKWFHCAAELGNKESVMQIAMAFQPDQCDEKDSIEAVSWFRRAAYLGDASAMFKLGVCFEKGNGVVKDLELAVSWYHRAADLGNVEAMRNLGWCYDNGTGVVKNLELAVSWYQRAADLGHVGAMFNLGVCYEDGAGVVKNPELAASWYQRAADLGYIDSMFNLGICFENGTGVLKNVEIAASWYRRAADLGDADAMFKLGRCFAHGIGVATDASQASSWYQRAADNGCLLRASNVLRDFGLCSFVYPSDY